MTTKKVTKKELDELFGRGVGEFIDPDGSFRKKLETEPERVIIKFGVDPTRPDIHLGHAVVLRKLRQFQELGCKVVFLVGDYTASIGDPTGKSKTRPEIEQKEIENNMKTYLSQVGGILKVSFDKDGNILNTNTFSWIRNSDWFTTVTDIVPNLNSKTTINITENSVSKEIPIEPNSFLGKAILFENSRMQTMYLKNKEHVNITLNGLLWTLKHITHSRLIERDLFQDRIKKGDELFMHEIMYPVIQGIDSFALARIFGSCDLEVGGTDQHFNMLVGRDVMKINKQKPQAVLSFKILEGLDGKEKMSKSLDNYVGITDEPNDMYGKIMSLPDNSIENYFELCTFTPQEEVQEIVDRLKKEKLHPKDVKMNLARQIVEIYHGKDLAQKAEENFINTFQKKETPKDLEKIKAKNGDRLMDTLVSFGIVESNAEFRRLVEGGAVTDLETSEKITDPNSLVLENKKLKIGKKRFIEVII